jgi:uncharacterized protein
MSDHAQLIIKIAERCNLNCSYCYMYTAGDQSWRERPAFLSSALRVKLIERCAEYLAADPHRNLTLEFHGGEPLLLGKRAFRELLARIRGELDCNRVFLCVQTNGVLLDDEWCDMFEEYEMSWSISCDGPPRIHDRFRVFHSGMTSSSQVERAIRLSVARDTRKFGGVLAVIDPRNDPRRIVRYFHELGVRDFDLLLPDMSHAAGPSHLPGFTVDALRDFLIAAFNEWIACGDARYRIRLFAHMIRALFGLRSGLDAFGGDLWGMAVVESDGTYQLLDVLRIHGTGEVATGLDLDQDSVDDFLRQTEHQQIEACADCKACPYFKVCGGGYLPHRFDGESYDRPSVHCTALFGLIAHIHAHVHGVTPEEMWTTAEAARPACVDPSGVRTTASLPSRCP